MERMDKIVLGGFGLVMLAGSAATVFIPNILVRSLLIGGMYFGLIGIVVMTDWMSTLEAGKNPHLKIVIRDPETGIGYPRDFYIGKPFPIGDPERGVDPTGEYAYGVGLPLIKGVDFSFFLPNEIQVYEREVFFVLALLKRPYNENFNFQHSGEPIALWNGIPVEHRGSDICESYLDPEPYNQDGYNFPVLLIKNTGVDALDYAKNFDIYRKIMRDIPASSSGMVHEAPAVVEVTTDGHSHTDTEPDNQPKE